MSSFPDYLLKLSVGLALIALFYHLILRKLTFYNDNRRYLWLYSFLCFCFPAFNINHFIAPERTSARVFVQSVPSITRVAAPEAATFPPGFPPGFPAAPSTVAETWTWSTADWIFYIWLAGVAVMTLRLLAHIRSYLRIRSQSRLISDDGVKIFHFDLEMSPFSFGRAIFYNPHLHKTDELQDMILHEYIHVQQWHSLDVLWSEILCIINWFNPFAWLIRSAIRQNLEYIADQKVLENHPDTKAYQYLLLKAAVGPEFSLVNQFGYHSLKQRFVMMNKNASPRALTACFLFILPLLAVMLAAFRPDQPGGKKVRNFWKTNVEVSERKPRNLLHMAGLLLDETGTPIAGLPLEVKHDDIYIKTIKTDKDGFYFAELPVKPEEGVSHTYKIIYDDPEHYLSFGSEETYHGGFNFGERFDYYFIRKRSMADLRNHYYSVLSKPFYDKYNPSNTRTELKAYLLDNVKPYREEMALRVDFVKTHRWSNNVITLYKGAYFDRKKQLVGYEGEMKIFLDGKKATPREVNDAFKNYPYMLNEHQEKRNWGQNNLSTEITYLTFPLYRDAPPAALVKGNVQVKDAKSFDPARLKNEPYLLDGFRQVYGASSNLIPEKQEIKRVMLLKGRLAKYYDSSVNEIWWIETRPVNEVFERPDFAAK
ncbi:Signal transducer regulating beta-lactamase production, contains metallopeptidase domain [Dyadobacter soli]|uniref:Signal transducer regulating beta-lactamase production, contains metallopeptidase domain n=1 Tax=Dyadobacter soli TaxID=659014 RepID=A0A1G6VVX2_9BACT|nr:M56 family metallopeptidase [Dyadobacter soli]SDD57739.1 Signal transducer regulating beta-lactamase production, contains metallopeptidase domain [Dyadobacter soli]